MFIVIDPKTLEVSTTDKQPSSLGLVVPTHTNTLVPYPNRFASIVYFEVLYEAVYREDERRGISGRAYSLVPPDPWLVAIAAIMWEGIIQGLSYDVVKTYVANGLKVLRAHSLAPPVAGSKNRTISDTEIHFEWTSYNPEGKKRREMFFDLKRTYDEMSETERTEVSKSLRAPLGEPTE